MGVGGQRHAPADISLRNNRFSLYRRLCGPKGRSGQVYRRLGGPKGRSGQVYRRLGGPKDRSGQVYRRLGGPKDRSGRVRKISPPRTVEHVESRYTD